MEYQSIKAIQDDLGTKKTDFYRCYKCARVLTRAREKFMFSLNEENQGTVSFCRCGSRKYYPTKPVFYEWLYPSVLGYTLKLVLARGLAPWCEKHCPSVLPFIEKMVRPKEA